MYHNVCINFCITVTLPKFACKIIIYPSDQLTYSKRWISLLSVKLHCNDLLHAVNDIVNIVVKVNVRFTVSMLGIALA